MFERLSFTRLAKQFKQSGQVSILFSLLMPIFLLFLGVALDLGWYYINVSRLQNAADAAAVAGAQTLLDSKNFDYKNVTLISKYPGKVSNQYRENDIYELTTIENGKVIAEEYAAKNLSGNENSLINSWTNNKVEFQSPKLYEQDDNLYFVVQLKDSIRHFFLSGWFDDMDAPVTAVAMLSRTAVVNTNTKTSDDSEMPAAPSSPEMPGMSLLPDMPTLPDNPLVISEEFKNSLDLSKNKNVIIGNWEVQNKYKNATGNMLTTYQERFKSTVYDKAWNHFQDKNNHYTVGDLYRKNTVNILDDVTADGQITVDGIKTYTSTTFGGNGSNVYDTPAALNNNKESTAYNPGKNSRGYPYLGERVDSLNIDFRQDVSFSENKDDPSYKWLFEDWDITLDEWDGIKLFNAKDWGSANEDSVKKLRVHASLNFNGAYKVRTNEDFLEKDENGKPVVDILWVRIESEPMLYHPDSLDGGKTGNVKISSLNSVNQIIINVNASNYDTATDNYRPVVMFYDGPETNDIYCDKESEKKHVRDSLPVILNLNKPFRGVLYAPNSPVVIIGDAKDNFRGFVVAKKYMRLKDESDFVFVPNSEDDKIAELSIYGLRTYYAVEDTLHKKPCYKITDENGIEMFVDKRGDIQFAELASPPTRYGSYDNFDRTDFSTENYKVLQFSADNMLLSGN